MKKITVSILSFLSSTLVFAQDSTGKIPIPTQHSLDTEIAHSVTNSNSIEPLMPLFAIAMVVVLVLKLIKYILDNKLKNKIIDRNISEQLASSILQKNATDKKDDTIKSAILCCGIGLGLTITHFTAPIDIHSLAIMALSFGLSYLAYFIYLRNQSK